MRGELIHSLIHSDSHILIQSFPLHVCEKAAIWETGMDNSPMYDQVNIIAKHLSIPVSFSRVYVCLWGRGGSATDEWVQGGKRCGEHKVCSAYIFFFK